MGIIATYNMKALVSVGVWWEQAFDDCVGEVHPQYTEPCRRLEVLNDSAQSSKLCKLKQPRLGFVCHAHLGWSSVSLKDEERTLSMQIVKENLNATVQ